MGSPHQSSTRGRCAPSGSLTSLSCVRGTHRKDLGGNWHFNRGYLHSRLSASSAAAQGAADCRNFESTRPYCWQGPRCGGAAQRRAKGLVPADRSDEAWRNPRPVVGEEGALAAESHHTQALLRPVAHGPHSNLDTQSPSYKLQCPFHASTKSLPGMVAHDRTALRKNLAFGCAGRMCVALVRLVHISRRGCWGHRERRVGDGAR